MLATKRFTFEGEKDQILSSIAEHTEDRSTLCLQELIHRHLHAQDKPTASGLGAETCLSKQMDAESPL